jgi:hypothetical protein
MAVVVPTRKRIGRDNEMTGMLDSLRVEIEGIAGQAPEELSRWAAPKTI